MKTNLIALIPLIVTFILPACVDHSAMTGAGDSTNSPAIVITQPATKDNITAVVDTLRDSFTRVAQATSGAQVPNPHLSILMPDGKTLEVPAPKSGDALFGENSPMARQQRLEGQLKALADKLIAGCSGTPVPGKVVKDTSATAFKGSVFQVWAAGGGANPWTTKEHPPTAFIEDRDSFAHILTKSDKQSGRYLILTDSTGASMPKPKPAKPIAGPAKPKATKTVAKPESKAVAAETKEKPAHVTQSSLPAVPARSGDNISINVSYPEMKKEGKEVPAQVQSQAPKPEDRPQRSAIKLPDGVEPLGKPILFAPGSAKLTREGFDTIAKVAAMLTASGIKQKTRIFLVGRADHTLDEASNKALSQGRADAVSVALLDLGVIVEQTYAIGESHSPDEVAASKLAQHRAVQMYALREATAATTAASAMKPLAQRVK